MHAAQQLLLFWEGDHILKEYNFSISKKSENGMCLPVFPNRCCYCNLEPSGNYLLALSDHDSEAVEIKIPYCEKHLQAMNHKDEISSSLEGKSKMIGSVIGLILGLISWPLFIKIKMFGLPAGLLWPAGPLYMGYTFGKARSSDKAAKMICDELGIPTKHMLLSLFDSKQSNTDWSIMNRSKIALGVGCRINKNKDAMLFKLRFVNDEYANLFAEANFDSLLKSSK